MKLEGRNVIGASRDQVWEAINDPAVLARTLPGCESLEVVADGHYKARVTTGVASIRGTYTGDVMLSNQVAPESLTLRAQGSGQAGTIGADVDVTLGEEGDDTVVQWAADAVVGGMIGGVGQRMLAGVSTRMAGDFFSNLEHDIVTGGVPAQAVDEVPAEVAAEGVEAGVVPGTVLQGSVSRRGAQGTIQIDESTRLVAAFLAGAAVALLGVWVGRRTA